MSIRNEYAIIVGYRLVDFMDFRNHKKLAKVTINEYLAAITVEAQYAIQFNGSSDRAGSIYSQGTQRESCNSCNNNTFCPEVQVEANTRKYPLTQEITLSQRDISS